MFDSCGGVVLTNNAPVSGLYPIGITTVTWTATDTSGNTSTAAQTITVIDITAPTLTTPVAMTATAGSGCTATVVLTAPIASDNCSGVTLTNNAPATFPIGNTVVTWTATDVAGNTVTKTQLVTVNDTIAPIITTPVAMTASAVNNCSAVVILTAPTATDNCTGNVSLTNNAPASGLFPVGVTTVIWTAIDTYGNVSTASQTVTVTDNIAPVITAPATITVNAGATCSATVVLTAPAVSDNCTAPNNIVLTNNSPATYSVGINTVTWTATDASGNSSTATQTINVIDVTAPTLTIPVAMTATAGSGCTATVVLTAPIASDNCSGVTLTNNAPATFPIGNSVVTWTATDVAGNTVTKTQLVTVTDTTAPTLSVPVAMSASAGNNCSAAVILTNPVATDNCTSPVILTNNAPASGLFPVGVTIVTWTATDAYGNNTSAIQTVTVTDDVAPIIAAPANITANAGATCTATIVLAAPVVSDTCGGVVVSNNAPTGGIYPVGTTTVTWTATDASGNISIASQLVNVIDATAPVFGTLPLISVSPTNNCIAIVTLPTPTVTDNCTSVVTITNNAPAGGIFPSGPTMVTWTATDEAGNVTTALQQVIVQDNTAPVAVTQDITVALDANGQATITAAELNNGSSDNCGILSITASPLTFDCNNVGPNTVVFTVTDNNGNVATANVTVTVVNNSVDTDGDAIKDNCDDDDDNDGVLDTVDNCPLTANADQADNDNDDLGDVCDDDDDNDGVLDTVDNCPTTSNPGQGDHDQDGIGDVCDLVDIYVSQAITPNGDGVNDTWMIYNIQQYPNSVISVYNKWGSEVFFAKNYNNDWNGYYKNETQPLPEGSYYFQIDLNGDGKFEQDGWVYITR